MPLFPNIRPKDKALAIIDAGQHPAVFKYAAANAEQRGGVSDRREQLWMEGYRRFGDEMEYALGRASKNIKHPRSWHRQLEAKLPDPWMLVGLTQGTMNPALAYAWKTWRYGDGEGRSQAEEVIRHYVNHGSPPPRFAEYVEWYRPLAGHGITLGRKNWTDFDGRKFHGWSYEDLLRVLDTGISAADTLKTGLKTADQVVLYTDGMPLEYAQEM